VWAASSLHEVADPDRVLSNVYAALHAGGLLVVVEMDDLPRFLPDDVGLGRPGLEARCHAALAQAGWPPTTSPLSTVSWPVTTPAACCTGGT
jgi:ubiquinone/menaquinone biosynthesis C-methylase UbiE